MHSENEPVLNVTFTDTQEQWVRNGKSKWVMRVTGTGFLHGLPLVEGIPLRMDIRIGTGPKKKKKPYWKREFYAELYMRQTIDITPLLEKYGVDSLIPADAEEEEEESKL